MKRKKRRKLRKVVKTDLEIWIYFFSFFVTE